MKEFENPSIEGVKNADTEDNIHYRSVEAEARMAARAREIAKKLNVPVRIVQSEEEAAQLPTRRKRRAKGWYDTTTGEVVIVVPNNDNMADIENTVAHEIVAHKGLRKLVGEERFDSFLDEVYGNLDGKIKAAVDARVDEQKCRAGRKRLLTARAVIHWHGQKPTMQSMQRNPNRSLATQSRSRDLSAPPHSDSLKQPINHLY